MDIKIVKELLNEYDQKEVDVYCNYIHKLSTEKKNWQIKNWWILKRSDKLIANYFKNVNREWLFFDGVHITLQSTGISYDYVAYKNKMLLAYPETIIDINLVHKWDDFTFSKENGEVVYSHKISDPFRSRNDDIIGGYAVIKNKRGEYLTTLWEKDLEKHRKKAKTDYIWKEWYAEMCLKTIMKKACKLHFGDIFTEIEEQDNENYDLDIPENIELEWKQEIDEIDTLDWLKKYYQKNKGKGKDFDTYISLRKQSIQNENS